MRKSSNGAIGTRMLSALLLLGIILLSIGFYLRQQQSSDIPATLDLHGTFLTTPRTISDFSLTNNEGKPITRDSLKGHWTYMFFGFTSCHHVCPTTMAELNQAYNKLKTVLTAKQLPKVMLVSVDPARDTVTRINAYVKGFNKNFIGATGSKVDIDKLAKSVGAIYMQTNKDKLADGTTSYDIDHSGAVMLLDPKAHLRAFFTMPHNADKLAQDFEVIVSKARV